MHFAACEQMPRLSKTVMPAPTYSSRRLGTASGSFASENPFFACEPSQKGLLLDPPQRHRNTVPETSYTFPSTASLSTRQFVTLRGPFAVGTMVGFALMDPPSIVGRGMKSMVHIATRLERTHPPMPSPDDDAHDSDTSHEGADPDCVPHNPEVRGAKVTKLADYLPGQSQQHGCHA